MLHQRSSWEGVSRNTRALWSLKGYRCGWYWHCWRRGQLRVWKSHPRQAKSRYFLRRCWHYSSSNLWMQDLSSNTSRKKSSQKQKNWVFAALFMLARLGRQRVLDKYVENKCAANIISHVSSIFAGNIRSPRWTNRPWLQRCWERRHLQGLSGKTNSLWVLPN